MQPFYRRSYDGQGLPPVDRFLRGDRSGYRVVAQFVKDSVGFIHIVRCVSSDPFGLRSLRVAR